MPSAGAIEPSSLTFAVREPVQALEPQQIAPDEVLMQAFQKKMSRSREGPELPLHGHTLYGGQGELLLQGMAGTGEAVLGLVDVPLLHEDAIRLVRRARQDDVPEDPHRYGDDGAYDIHPAPAGEAC